MPPLLHPTPALVAAKFGFPSKWRILPSVTAAQPQLGPIDPPLTVLWLIKGLGAGGAERLVVQSARYRDKTLVEPSVAYLLSEKSTLVASLEHLGCPVQCLGARSSWDPRWILRLRRILASGHFDVIHIHSPLVADRSPSGGPLARTPQATTHSGHRAQRLDESRAPDALRRPGDRGARRDPPRGLGRGRRLAAGADPGADAGGALRRSTPTRSAGKAGTAPRNGAGSGCPTTSC